MTKEEQERLASKELETARYVRDVISKSDDTKAVFKLVLDLQRAYESRVLLDSGEGKHPDGRVYTPEDFWTNVGEIRGLRWLGTKVSSLVRRANEADEEDRKRKN